MTASEIKSIVEEMISIRNACREEFFKSYPDSSTMPRTRWWSITARIANFIDDGDLGVALAWRRDLQWLKEIHEGVLKNV